MAIYQDYAKISLVQLPNGSGATTYALVDRDGRLMITEQFSTASAQTYNPGDYVIYEDNLYICTAATTGGTFDANDWMQTDVAQELISLKNSISGGIHYIGVTYSSLYEGSTTNPIYIGALLTPHTAIKGDLTIEQPPTYAANTAYIKGQYIIHESTIYQITKDITAGLNTNWAIMTAGDYVKKGVTEPEFIWDGAAWNEIGSISPNVFGKLAFKDAASGTYTKPTGSGQVSIPTVTVTSKKLSTTTITGTNGTESVSAVSGGSTKDIAKVGTAIRYGTANVGTAVTYGTANRAASPTTVGNANVGTAVVYGTANKASTATTVGNANVGSATVYGKANKKSTATQVGTALGGTTTFNTEGYTATVNSNETLVFTAGNTATVTLTKSSIYEAVDAPSTQTLTPAAASSTTIYGAVDAPNTQKLTPAAASTTTIYGAETSTATLTPAVAAPNDQTLTPAESNGTLTGSYTIAAKTVAKAAASATTVATGELETGDQLVSDVTVGSQVTPVTVGTTTDTVAVS